MEFAWFRLISFLILTIGDVGTAIYDRYFGGVTNSKVKEIKKWNFYGDALFETYLGWVRCPFGWRIGWSSSWNKCAT